MKTKDLQLSNITVSDVDMQDYPDFSDAFIEEVYSDKLDRWLTEDEINDLMDQSPEIVQDFIHENLSLYL